MFRYLKILINILSLNTLKLFSLCMICLSCFGQSDENIALKKPAFQSSTRWNGEANNTVDGNYNQDYYKNSCAHGEKEDNILNWLEVDLMDMYYISSVILTPRNDAVVVNVTKRLDYVYVGISNFNVSGKVEYPVYPLCRQSPYAADRTQNMSISCRPNTPPGRYVVVQQPTTMYGYLTICEIQVYGIKLYKTSQGNSSCQGNYYGDNCDKYCNCDKGLTCDQQGICPNGCDVNWEGEHCDNRIYNSSQLLGCFEFSDSSNHQFGRINSQSCLVTCSGYGFTFAANMTSDICICTNNLNWKTSCQEKCSPQNCKNFYSVCPNGTYGYDCTLKCNCLNKGRCSYMEGRCEDGCANGWTGDSCNLRNCTSDNGGCDKNEICVSNSSEVKSCQCKEDFNRASDWLPCQKICPNGTYGYNCTLKCNCLNNGRCSYMEGRCEDGCADGWTGDSCNIRNCTIFNGGCGENATCISNSSDLSSCQCKQGFNRTSVWSTCQEIIILDPSDSKNEINKSAIIGGVIGSIAGLCLIAALAILFVKRKKRKAMIESASSLTKEIYLQKESISLNDTPSPERKLKLQELPDYVTSNRTKLAEEFRNLNRSEESHLKQTKEVSSKLNRFKNILPYQHNRVKLIRKAHEDRSDYINASYIQGVIKDALIAAQGPVKNSVDDFWEMVWQQDVGIIIMLCNYVEQKKVKCEQYLHEENNFTAGKYTIENQKTVMWPPFKMMELRISMNGQQRSLIHLHFTEWPDHGVPNNVFYLLDFCRRCQKLYEREKCGILVHCSAGVGRTGSFLAIYDLLVKGYQGLDISVPETVNNLRKQRMNMVEKQVQFNFIYEALAEEVKVGQTSFSKEEFAQFFHDSKEGGIERSHFIYQHRMLSNFYSGNATKDESMTFIKAITSEYKFCLMLSRSSLNWKHIPDCECMIVFDPRDENGFIPKVGQPVIDGQMRITLVDKTISEWGSVLEVQKKGDDVSTYENVDVNAYENITMSRDKSLKIFVVDTKEDYLDFPTFMELFSQLPTDENITIVLGNNHKLGYFFMAACNIISQLKVYDEVAILQNLCELCKVTDYQPSQISFEKLHQLANEFILTSQ